MRSIANVLLVTAGGDKGGVAVDDWVAFLAFAVFVDHAADGPHNKRSCGTS